MNRALRTGVCALFVSYLIAGQGIGVFAKDAKDAGNGKAANASAVSRSDFAWHEGKKLTWDDFRGPVKTDDEETAAATHCGIGFRINPAGEDGNPAVEVYNKFYINKSWVKPDAKLPTILVHEQGHFDLCEIYTRKLRARLSHFNFDADNVKDALMNIYNEVSDEYERRQQAYEQETAHGTIADAQKKWTDAIAKELM